MDFDFAVAYKEIKGDYNGCFIPNVVTRAIMRKLGLGEEHYPSILSILENPPVCAYEDTTCFMTRFPEETPVSLFTQGEVTYDCQIERYSGYQVAKAKAAGIFDIFLRSRERNSFPAVIGGLNKIQALNTWLEAFPAKFRPHLSLTLVDDNTSVHRVFPNILSSHGITKFTQYLIRRPGSSSSYTDNDIPDHVIPVDSLANINIPKLPCSAWMIDLDYTLIDHGFTRTQLGINIQNYLQQIVQ